MLFRSAKYSPTSAQVSMKMSKNGISLITFSAEAAGNVTDDDVTVKGTILNFDVLSKMQIKGNCTNSSKLVEYLEKADDNDENEGTFKSYLSQANSLLDLNLYYNSNVKQAQVKLEPFYESNYGYAYWNYEPALFFKDGTSYSTFSTFFDEDDFKDLIKTFERLLEDFDDMIYD